MRALLALTLCTFATACGTQTQSDPAGAMITFSYDQTTGHGHFDATFSAKTPTASQSPDAGCVTPPGECATSDCPWGAMGPPGGSIVSAGKVTIGGGALPQGGLLAPAPAYSLDISPFAKGDALTVEASGADFPHFDTQAITAPGLPTLTAPAAPYAVALAQDLTVTWQGGEPNATFYVTATANDPAGPWVSCRIDATSGSVTIPAALLASLKGASGPTLVWGQERDQWFTVDTAPVEMRAVQLTYVPATFE